MSGGTTPLGPPPSAALGEDTPAARLPSAADQQWLSWTRLRHASPLSLGPPLSAGLGGGDTDGRCPRRTPAIRAPT
jgi:hypothetical protein